MDTEVWPGNTLSSSGSHDRFSLRADDTGSSESLSDSSSDLSSEEDDALPQRTTPREKGKQRKRVTFQTEENLVEIFEIPARGEDLFDEICEVIEQSPLPQNSAVQQDPETDLKISGHAAELSVGQTSEKSRKDELPERLPKPERPDRAVLNRRNTDVWGTYTVTHTNTPANSSGTNSQPRPQRSPSSQHKPRATSNPRNFTSADLKTPPLPPPKPPVPVQRKNFRVRSAGKGKKKGTKTVKDSKNSSAYDNTLGQDENDGEKLIAMFLEKNAHKEESDGATGVKNPKQKATKRGPCRRTTSSARNREKEMINKEMKGEVQRRVFKTYNNISSLHRPGQRQVNRGQNPGDCSDRRSGSDKTRCKSANKHSLSVDNGKLNSGPKVKVGRARQGSADSAASGEVGDRDNACKDDTQHQSNGKHGTAIGSGENDKPVAKSNGFIFPEEKTFHFPLMSPPKETTSQLVRLDSNMLSLYKKKLYAWHMANGTVVEGRIETPCISPMWEPLKPSYS